MYRAVQGRKKEKGKDRLGKEEKGKATETGREGRSSIANL